MRSNVLTSQRVLVVVENHDAADSLAALLRFLGAEVKVAYGGDRALSAVEEFHPSVVLLDLGLPEVSAPCRARIVTRPNIFDFRFWHNSTATLQL